jgi:hypothetical protein
LKLKMSKFGSVKMSKFRTVKNFEGVKISISKNIEI